MTRVTATPPKSHGAAADNVRMQPSAVEISSRPGTLFDFHCTAQGKIALAFGPRRLWKKVLRSPLRQWTEATMTDLDRLRAEVDKVRKRGWAVAPGEVLSGINALAAPVFDAGGRGQQRRAGSLDLPHTVAAMGAGRRGPARERAGCVRAQTDERDRRDSSRPSGKTSSNTRVRLEPGAQAQAFTHSIAVANGSEPGECTRV